jgi:predicted MFS family arabinose efflux permease
VAEAQIPLLFALAMASDAMVALGVGRLYDRRGLAVLASVPPVTAASLVVFSDTPALAWIGAELWGSVLGMQESTLRAAVGDFVKTKRATAYGIFNAAYGLALLAGGSFLGLIYERSVPVLVACVMAVQLLALLIFAPLRAAKPFEEQHQR